MESESNAEEPDWHGVGWRINVRADVPEPSLKGGGDTGADEEADELERLVRRLGELACRSIDALANVARGKGDRESMFCGRCESPGIRWQPGELSR